MKKKEIKKTKKLDIDEPGKKVIDEENYADDAAFDDEDLHTPEFIDEEGIHPWPEENDDE